MIHIHTYIYIYTNKYDTAFSSCFYQYITDDTFSVHILVVSINIYIYISPSAIYAFSVDVKFSLPRQEVISLPRYFTLSHPQSLYSTLDCEKCGIRTRYSQLPQQFCVLPHVHIFNNLVDRQQNNYSHLFTVVLPLLSSAHKTRSFLLESNYDLFLSLINFNLISLFQEI